ncbi:hypothetical protein ACFFRR_001045 [Megaselia abdita]
MVSCSFCSKYEKEEGVYIRSLTEKDENSKSYKKMLNEIFKDLQIHPSNRICNSCISNLTISYNFYNQCIQISNKMTMKNISSDEKMTLSDKRLYTCPHCSQKFRSFASLKKHETIHDVAEQCSYCRKVFPSEYDVDSHAEVEHPNKKYACIFCPEVKYNKLFYLLGHLSSVHKSASPANFCFECGDKSDAFQTCADVLEHIKEQHSSKLQDDLSLDMHEEFLDDFFLNDFDMWDDMNFSMDFDLSKLNSGEIPKTSKIFRYLCPKCNDGFDHQKDLYLHAAEIHEEFTLTCKKCGKRFSRIEEMKLHRLSHIEKPSHGNDFDCKVCGRKFTSRKGAEYHAEVKHLSLNYECLYCSKNYPSAINLNRHINQQHSNVRMHFCSLCDRDFSTLDHLKKHVESGHQKVKNFLCTVCGKTFSQLCHLKEHSTGCEV